MRISEMFYSLQGEGRTLGVPSVFLRLGGCNLLCGGMGTVQDKGLHDGATWRCDTIEVWSKASKVTPGELLEEFSLRGFTNRIMNGAHLVVTGGEPLQQQAEVEAFVRLITNAVGFQPYVEIETNGTLLPNNFLKRTINQFNVSPKLANSGMPSDRRITPEAVIEFRNLSSNHTAIFKFVISSEEDLEEAERDFIKPYFIPHDAVWLMPAADSRATLNEAQLRVATLAIEKGYNFSYRMHLQLWDRKTGV